MIPNKHILIIAYEFPPLNTGGAHRPYKMAKYLAQRGHKVTVVTQAVQGDQKVDNSIAIPDNITVLRAGTKKRGKKHAILSTYYFNVLDVEFSLWQEELLKTLAQIFDTGVPDTAIVTVPPFSMGQTLTYLKSVKGLKVLLDMRDAWSNWNISPFASILHYKRCVKHEHNYLMECDTVLVTSEQTRIELVKTHGSHVESKIHLVPNGFEGYESEPVNEITIPPKSKWSIGYLGSFYYNPQTQESLDKKWWQKRPYQYFQYSPRKEDWSYRSPLYFFRTLQSLIKDNPQFETQIEIIVAGNKPYWFDSMVAAHKLEKVVHHIGFLPKTKALDFLKSKDLLLLTSAKVVGDPDYSIAGKTYEYLSLMKPILAFVCEGAQKAILQLTGTSLIFDPDDVSKSKEQFLKVIKEGIHLKPDLNEIKNYEMEEIVKKLDQLV